MLITRKVKVEDIGLPQWAKKALKDRGMKENEVEMIRKGVNPEDTKINKGERSTIDYITTKAVDRDGDIVVPKGAILDHYRKNPVVLFGHDYKSLPVGKSLWIKADEKGLISKTQYARHKKAEEIYQYRKDGFPLAKSIGFIPLSVVEESDFDKLDLKALDLTESDLKGAARVYPEWLMLEYSDVPVPSNPEALQLAISKGIITMEEAKEQAGNNAFVIEIIEPEDKKEMLEKRYEGIEISDDEVEKDVDSINIDIEIDGKGVSEVIEKSSEPKKDKSFSAIKELKVFKDVEGASGKWNKNLSDAFDVDKAEVPPSTVLYGIASKWLDCKIKDMFLYEFVIPSSMMGNYLSGFKESLKEHKLVTSRNFRHDGSESPLIYDVIQLNSETSETFLVNGMSFYEKDDKRFILSKSPGWYGLEIGMYSSFDDSCECHKVISDTKDWIKKNNLLRGESFSLGGEFIPKSEVTWDSLFLNERNQKAVKGSVDLINRKKHDLPNRGLIFMGPPGTGKTLSGRIIRNETDATFIWVSARDFAYSGAVGGMSYGFSLARELAPTVLFVEDIDNWLTSRACDLMKTEMDGISQSKGVVTILTSNYPEMLPDALIDRPGRFHDVLNFSLPDSTIRMKMLKSWAQGVQEKVVSDVVENTVGFSGAHMYELVEFAKNIMDDEDTDINNALLLSLNKIKEQRELINEVRNKDFDENVTVVKDVKNEVESEEKAGRVLSKKTISIISDALSGMEKATGALNDLVDSADFKDEEEQVSDEEADGEGKNKTVLEIKEEKEQLLDVNEETLKKSIESAFSELLRSAKPDIGNIVKETLDKRNGRIF